MKNLLLTVISLLVLLPVCCVKRDNPLDEWGDHYSAPEIYLQDFPSSIHCNDTIHFDTGSIVLEGNRDESRFRVTLDDARAGEWKTAGTFSFTAIDDGRHVLTITSRYVKGSRITTDSVLFFVETAGYKPVFQSTEDTVVSVETGTPVTLMCGAAGADTLTFEWMKNDTLLAGAGSAAIIFTAIEEADAGTYYCKAKNRYGEAGSGKFIIKVHAPPLPVRNRIYYNANGADGGEEPIDVNLYYVNDLITIVDNTGSLFKNNYSFAGWVATPEDTGDVYSAGSVITMDTFEIIMYAKWIENHLVMFISQGGDSIPPQSVSHGAKATLPDPAPERTNHTFVGWYKESETVNAWDFATAITAPLTLYAQWEIQCTFKVFLCFGQSNMSGGTGVSPDNESKKITPRVKVLGFATSASGNISRTANEWSDACEPMHCGDGVNAMGPSYAFGKVLADSLPNDTIGLIPCGQWGVGIEYFQKGGIYTGNKPSVPGGNNVYDWMLEKCQVAQERGVFSGIILHQGESNSGDEDWPAKVKDIVDDLKSDLSITDDIPVVAGELLYSGCCPGHNTLVNKIPETIPNSYVASANGLSGGGTIPELHFNQAGYRELGKRYAIEMLKGLRLSAPSSPLQHTTSSEK
jgi:uncharacterized repeat protein (TIGR02543 family)